MEELDPRKGGNFYDPSVSITAQNQHRDASITFVGASLDGKFFKDDVHFGVKDGKPAMTTKSVTIGKVDRSSFFTGKPGDLEAVIGMGYPALAEKETISLPDEMMNQNLLQSSMFAFSLKSKPELTFGYYDKAKFKGELSWNKVTMEYMYLV
jgi:hypothetical protein